MLTNHFYPLSKPVSPVVMGANIAVSPRKTAISAINNQ
jgi:hypothetical protein